MKVCTKCKIEKEFSEFAKRSKSKDGLEPQCRNCQNTTKKIKRDNRTCEEKEANRLSDLDKYHTKTPDQKKAKYFTNEQWCKANPGKMIIKASKRKEKKNNRTEEQKEIERVKDNDKYLSDINYRLKKILRSRLRTAVKNNQKSGSAVSDLGCSIDYFKKYIEDQFEPWMNWDNWAPFDYNRKTWHMDHINALANFDLSNREELLKVVHFSNLQPLLAKDNIKKSNKLLMDIYGQET